MVSEEEEERGIEELFSLVFWLFSLFELCVVIVVILGLKIRCNIFLVVVGIKELLIKFFCFFCKLVIIYIYLYIFCYR